MNRYSVDQLTEMARGFQAASILIAAAELDVFTILDAAPVAGEELARRLSADARATVVLLDALASMDLLEKRDGGYSVPADLVPILTEAGESSILGTLRHQGNCMRCWGQLAKVVLTGRPCREESVRGSAADIESFIRAMNEISGRIAAALVKSIGPLQFTHLLDIGGASGTWTILFLQLYPGAKATIFDLPEVISMAAGVAAAPGMAGRIRLAAGDYNTDEFPPGADLAWVSAIVHQNSRDQNRGPGPGRADAHPRHRHGRIPHHSRRGSFFRRQHARRNSRRRHLHLQRARGRPILSRFHGYPLAPRG
jgi:hypothetical protein